MGVKRITVSLFIVVYLFFINVAAAYADNLLLNSSFEDISSGAPSNWTKNVSTATISTSSTIKTGTYSVSINKTNSTTGSVYLYQDVDVEVGSYYSISGWVVKNDAKFSYALLRISWRDGSQELSKTDSSQLTSDSSDFQQLKIDSVQAPSGVLKARIELLANISSVNPSNPVLFDDVAFSQVSAPEQPTATPTSSPTPTPTSTPTASPTPKPSTPKPTVTPTPEIDATLTSSDSNILGVQDMNSASPSPGGFSLTDASRSSSPSFLDKITQTSPLAFVFVFLGIFFLGFAGYSFLRQKAQESSDTIDSAHENT
jgi:hypothetical protein